MYMEPEEIIAEIRDLKKKLNALIITHNYQLGEVQDIADFTGDSLELSIKAAETDADLIVFCGVKFMAETAFILSPSKTVLLPVMESGCPMADMADAKGLIEMKKQHPGALAVCYVNSTAEVKAECDMCVTSANAVHIVSSLPKDKKIIFLPDRNLGAYVAHKTGRDMILWPGFCPTHMRITVEHLKKKKAEFPDAKIIVHPESRMEVINMADEVLSTGGMCKYVSQCSSSQIIVATEMGLIHRLQKENPSKKFIPVSEQAVCPNMKMTRLEDVLASMKNMKHIIKVPEETRRRALMPIQKMLEESKKMAK